MNDFNAIPKHNRWLVLLFLLLVMAVPFLYAGNAIDPVLTLQFTVKSLVTLVLMVGLLVLLFLRQTAIQTTILNRAIFPAFLSYVLIGAVSVFQAKNQAECLFEIIKVGLFYLFFLVISLLLSNYKTLLGMVVKVILLTTLVLALVAIFQYIQIMVKHPTKFTAIYRITATLSHKNMLAQVLLLTMPFLLYGAFLFRAFWQKFSWVVIALVLAVIVLLQTRSVWVGTLLSFGLLALAAILFLKRTGWKSEAGKAFKKTAVTISVIMVTAIIATIFINQWVNTAGPIAKRAKAIADPQQKTAKGRLIKWKETWHMFQDHPIGGVGLGNWKIELPLYKIDKTTSERIFQRPHNDFLWLLSETGVPGLIAYLSIFVLSLFYSYQIIFGNSSREHKIMTLLFFTGIISYLIISCFSFPKERIIHQVYLLLLMSGIVSLYHQNTPAPKRSFLSTKAIFSGGILLLMFGVYLGSIRFNGEVHTQKALEARKKALKAHQEKDWQTVIREINKAYHPYYNMDPTSVPIKWYSGLAYYTLGNTKSAYADFNLAKAHHPHHVYVLTNLATCQYLEGQTELAIENLQAALGIDPTFHDAVSNLVSVYYNEGRYQDALQILEAVPDRSKELEEKYRLVQSKLAAP